MRISDWSSDVCSSDLARSGNAKSGAKTGANTGERPTFAAKFACPVSGFTIDEIEPRLFSFNNPFGACPACDGLGITLYFDPDLVVPDPKLPLSGGAVAPWSRSSTPSPYYQQTLDSIARHFKVSTRTPWAELKPVVRDTILYGSGKAEIARTRPEARHVGEEGGSTSRN